MRHNRVSPSSSELELGGLGLLACLALMLAPFGGLELALALKELVKPLWRVWRYNIFYSAKPKS